MQKILLLFRLVFYIGMIIISPKQTKGEAMSTTKSLAEEMDLGCLNDLTHALMLVERDDMMENLLDVARLTHDRLIQAQEKTDIPMLERGFMLETKLKKFLLESKIMTSDKGQNTIHFTQLAPQNYPELCKILCMI